jgi:glycosyltransferase involved in cell wall biosynthesis
MRILLLAEGDPETWESWSGSSRGLLRALRALGHDVIPGDVCGPDGRRWRNMLRAWVPDRRRWAARYHFGAAGFRDRGNRAKALLARHASGCDAVIQIGATFNAFPWTTCPGFVYCDSNAALTARDAPAGEVAALRPAERVELFAREQQVYSGARAVFVMSEYLRRSMIGDFSLAPERVHTVWAGANLDLEGLEPAAGRAQTRPPTILFVGKQWERKGGPLLLEAFDRVRRAVPDARLRIVGCTPAIPSIHTGIDVVGPLPKQAPGGQQRLSALYQSADIFCMPSRFEPFGVVFVEAMLHGLPCVGSRRCAIPEIIADGDTGWVVGDDDASSLADVLVSALKRRSVLHEMGRRGRARALELFTWQRVAERVVRTLSRQTAPVEATA